MYKQSLTQLRFLVFGAGAIGTYIGGSLALSGQKVVFLERPNEARGLRRRGLYIELANGKFHYKNPDIVLTIEEALTHGPFDVVIFAVKAYDTYSVLKYMSPYVVALPPFLCLQNGVDNEEMLEQVLGAEKIIPAVVTSSVSKNNVGDVTLERLRGVGIGSGHVLVPTLVNVMDAAGLHVHQFRNGRSMKWSKMLTNLLANASSAILNLSPQDIFAHAGLYQLEIQQLREAQKVMSAQGIGVINLPGTPVRLLSIISRLLSPKLSRPLLIHALGIARGAKMPSLNIDLLRGCVKSEVNGLNGAIVRMGKKLGIQTPVNQFMTQTLMDIVSGKLSKETYAGQPDKFLEAFKNQYSQE